MPNIPSQHDSVLGPFGEAHLVRFVSSARVAAMYLVQCGVDISAHFNGHPEIALYQCEATGMLFWRPEDIAGNELLYQELDAQDGYYKDWRWEYDQLDRYLARDTRMLEVGCGKGYFLQHTQGRVLDALGIEFNQGAIARKVTTWPIQAATVEGVARSRPAAFDLVCSFHVLEHVVDPASFIASCLDCLRPGGRLVLSVPNHENVIHAAALDAFDLPPHHVNHFTPATFRRIAAHYGLTLERLEVQPRTFNLEAVTTQTSGKISYRIARLLARKAFSRLYRREPGHTFLAVMQKPLQHSDINA